MTIEKFHAMLRILSLLALGVMFIYWHVTETVADKAKPKSGGKSFRRRLTKNIVWLLEILVALQLLGFNIYPMETELNLRIIGLVMVIMAVIICILSRKDIGTNWTHAADYQIKPGHELITKGLYSYIRHPIYLGLYLAAIGAELVSGSYLLFVFLLIIPFGIYYQARKEEKVLLEEFGAGYRDYMQKTKMFIPYIW